VTIRIAKMIELKAYIQYHRQALSSVTGRSGDDQKIEGIYMKRFFVLITTMAALLQLSGCGFSLGSSASPPGDLQIAAGDSSITATWTMAPGVQYWMTTTNATTNTEALVSQNVVSPQQIAPLVNGQPYSFVMDARTNDGPAGSKTIPITATPRNSGVNWTPGTNLPMDVAGVAYNPAAAASTIAAVLVGANGAIYSSLDGLNWTPQTNPNPSPAVTLNAARFGGYYMAAGRAGTILTSPDAITWTNQITGTGNDLYAIASNGAGEYIATGANGTIIVSSNGVNWSTAASGTSNSVNGVAYGNYVVRYVAVGANSTLLTSTDTLTWLPIANTFGNLNSVTYGSWIVPATGALVSSFVAVGDGGTIITSPDGLTWTAQTPVTTNKLTAVDFGRQFVAVGSNGTVLTSAINSDGTLAPWLTQSSGTATALSAITHSAYGYFAVGAAGTNLSTF